MTVEPSQRLIAADAHRVPQPFRTLAVRSEQACHATDARAPYGQVHLVRTAALDAATLAGISALGRARVRSEGFSDIRHARTSLAELTAAAPRLPDLAGTLATALQCTAVLGHGLADYQHSLGQRIDYLATCGAGFHNDVRGHWSRCLFWLLALDLHDVELVLPHASLRLPLAVGDLVVFDPTMAHGLCRPADAGQARADAFETGDQDHQLFLTGELLLSDAQWATLGAPWLPVAVHAQRGALDLMVAEFDDCSGAIKRPRLLLHCMQGSSLQLDGAPD